MRKLLSTSLLLLLCFGLRAQGQPIQEDKSKVMLRVEHEVNMTKDPALGYVPKNRIIQANQYRENRLKQPTNGPLTVTPLTWTERGPDRDQLGPSNGNTRGPGNAAVTSGRIRTVWEDLSDPSGKTVWVGGISGGLWKTTDITSAGAGWTLVNDKLPNLAVSSICQDPTSHNIMYFGTGEKTFGGAVMGAGIWQSTDNGASWNVLAGTSNFVNVSKVLCDAAGNLYAATVNTQFTLNAPPNAIGGLFRKAKGSNTWTDITPAGMVRRIADMDLSTTGRLHITCGYLDGGNTTGTGYRYTDNPAGVAPGGWNSSVAGAQLPCGINTHLASKGDTLYALPSDAANQLPLIFKSEDGGVNWTSSAAPNNVTSGQGFYCLAVAVDPNSARNVIIGSLDCFKTTDGGASWNKITEWVGTNQQYVHADQQIITWRSNNQVLIGGDGGIDYSANGGTNFADRNRGLRIKQFYSVAVHPTATNYFLTGTQDNGSHKFTTPGMNNSIEVRGGDGGFTHIDQDQPQFQWISYVFNDYYTSTDAGINWNRVTDNVSQGLFINPTDYDDINNRMYCSGNVNTYVRWDNPQSGNTFVPVNMFGLGGGKVTALKVSPYTNNTVYFGGGGNGVNPRLIRVANAHTTPVFTNPNGPFSNINTANISCIELGRDENHLLVSLSNYGVNNVWFTTDAGATWSACDGNLPDMPVRWAMFYPGSNEAAIIATETGVWQTDKLQGAATVWQPEAGFPNVRTDMLHYRRDDRLLAAATHGRGLFTAIINPDLVTGLIAGPVTNSVATLRWDSTGDAQKYEVDYKLASSAVWISAGTNIVDTFIVINGLKDNSTYDWRVRAKWGPLLTSSTYSSAQFNTMQFAVTTPNTTTSFIAGSTINVNWSGSTAPLSPTVKISLSTDGGINYTRVLAAADINDNSTQVVLPRLATTLARIKIESIDTIPFFDVSDTNFIITPEPVECTKLDVQVWKRDTSFTCVTSDDNGFVYAGTQTKGIQRYENGIWKNYSYGLTGLIPWKRTWIRQMSVYNNQLWVAHSGYISPIGLETDYYRYGGVERINVLNGPGSRQNFRGQRVINIDVTIGGPATRNTFGVLPDTATGRIWAVSNYADSLSYPADYNYNARYWYKTGGVSVMAPGQANFFRIEQGLPNPFQLGVGTGTAGTENLSVGKRRSASAITTDSNEVLVSVGGFRAGTTDTIFKAGIMRYNRSTGAFIGKYDQNNTPLPFGLANNTPGAPAMYTDVKGRVWVALGGPQLAVKDTSGWHYIGAPTWLGNGGAVQPNAISGDRKGVIYFGTDKGLLVFNNNEDTTGTGSYTKDSSYCFYTTANNLPSNYIRGTHVDRSGNIWLATGAGVCKIQKGDLLMYNLKPQSGGNYVTNDEGKRLVVAGFDPGVENSDTIRVAADGSSATLFKWQGKDPKNLKAVIKEGAVQADFGKVSVLNRSEDSLILQYRHPDYLSEPFLSQGRRTLTLQLYDTTLSPVKLIIEVKLVIVAPPVLCLHGIWSSGEAFSLMTKYLSDSAGYKGFMVSAPSYTNDVYFANNQYVARDEAAKLLTQCADNNMSAGKVDIIAHSMGGILSRIFLQNAEYNQTFNKLITVNTPHSGSQIADLVRTSPALSLIVNGILGNNTDNGALEDLRVTKDGIRVLLNGPGNLNRNKIPVHAISSDYTDLQVYELLANITLTVASYIPALGRVAAVAKRMLAIIKHVAYSGTTCDASESVHNCLKNKIFEDANDIAVAKISQQAGLPVSAISFFSNISHNSILDRSEVFNKLKSLLKVKTTDGSFTSNGYNPVTLDYNASINGPAGVTSETVTINSPVSGATYPAGQTINLDVSGSANVKKILMATGNATMGMGYYNSPAQNYLSAYQIPKDAVGRLFIVAIGYDQLGRPTMDSALINVGPPAGVTLDSIRIENRRNLKVFRGDSLWLKITGYYSDTVRDISNVADITYVVDDVNVRLSNVQPNYVIGQVVGYDNFRATLQGKADTGYIEVLEKPVGQGGGGAIPVVLSSFTGKLAGNVVQLNWTTAQEANTSHFEVQRSADGISFSGIGRVNAAGFSNTPSNYGLNDFQFGKGNNYYRLKQVDADGRFTYSQVVLIRIKKSDQPVVVLYPNPTGPSYINLNVAEGLHPQWTMKVYNASGQELLQHIIPANQNNEAVNISRLKRGLYVVRVETKSGEKIYTGKLVVQ